MLVAGRGAGRVTVRTRAARSLACRERGANLASLGPHGVGGRASDRASDREGSGVSWYVVRECLGLSPGNTYLARTATRHRMRWWLGTPEVCVCVWWDDAEVAYGVDVVCRVCGCVSGVYVSRGYRRTTREISTEAWIARNEARGVDAHAETRMGNEWVV